MNTERVTPDPNAAQLKHALDRGGGADKVDFPDPAAAPLGTDAEAGGTPPSGAAARQALAAETARAHPAGQRPGRGAMPVLAGFLVLIAVSAILTLLIMASL